MEELLRLQFRYLGDWKEENGVIDYDVENNAGLDIPNSLYAFVIKEGRASQIGYIGKTTQTLERRLYKYSRGNGQNTNSRVHNLILASLRGSKTIEIWAFTDNSLLSWGGFNINLAAGLEDDMIMKLNPIWNHKS